MAFVNLSSGDRDNGHLQLELIIDDYAGTKAARHSKFMLARLYYEQKDYLTAKLYLLDFLDDPTDEFHVGALILMADIEKFNGNSDGEEKYIKQSMKYASSKSDKDCPESRRAVGNRSNVMAVCPETPGRILPGHQAIVGTRTPPS